jgi:Conjugative transposon protein TcpC
MLSNTWRGRITTTGAVARRAGLIAGFTACSIVATATIWGWLTDQPIDVATPARGAVNRTALVGSYAQDCVTRWLTVTSAQQHSLDDCFSLHDPIQLPTNLPVIVSSPAVSAITLVNGGNAGKTQQWSVVVSVCERPYPTAAPHTALYRLPVVYNNDGLRASALPARINGAGTGPPVNLGYQAALPVTSPAFTTVAGFVNSYLTNAGGLEELKRYVTAKSGLVPTADYHSAKVVKLVADHAIPDADVPADGTSVHVLATVDAVTRQFAPLRLDYPIVLTVTSGRWCVLALDYAPLLASSSSE